MRIIASVIVLLLAFGAFAQNPGFRLAQTVLEIDSDADGKADSILVWSYTYDHHNLLRVVADEDFNADGIMDEIQTRTQTYVHGAARH